MAHDGSQIRPETYALDTVIKEAVSRAHRGALRSSQDALLVLGNWHHAIPALVVQDPVLEPVDKLIWMVIYQSGRGMGEHAVFPSYRDICRLANVSSTSTVARAIAILRATRWLSLCARQRDPGGRFRGNVYALHDEPLPLADALHLDADYMTFLKGAHDHHHARVRRIVAAILGSLEEDIRSGKDVLEPEDRIARRLEAVSAIADPGERRYFGFSPAALEGLGNTSAAEGLKNQDQNSKSDDKAVRISKSNRGSSKYINTTTTVTSKIEHEFSGEGSEGEEELIFPAQLPENQRELARRYLARVPANERQDVLDELEGRLQAVRLGAKPLYDAMRYLHGLCQAVTRNEFEVNLGVAVREARERKRDEAARRQLEIAERKAEPRAATPRGESPVAEIKKQLGLRGGHTPKPR